MPAWGPAAGTALLCASATAWAPVGHDRVLSLAQTLLPGRRRAEVAGLLKGDLLHLGSWELDLVTKHPQTEPLLWHVQEPSWTCDALKGRRLQDEASSARCVEAGPGTSSLFCAILYFFERATTGQSPREPLRRDKPVHTPSALPALDGLPEAALGVAPALRWLIALLGDLHQPLHLVQDPHDYGRDVQITWEGENYRLLDFWETYLPAKAETSLGPRELDREFQERAMSWGYQSPQELFRDWAKLSAQAGCAEVYGWLEAALERSAPGASQTPIPLPEAVYHKWLDLARDQLTLAGERVAFILEDILEHNKRDIAHKEGRGRRRRGSGWLHNFCTNALIALIVVPVMLLILHAPSRSDLIGRVVRFGKSSAGKD